MKTTDWDEIEHFTAAEIAATGADPEDVDVIALKKLDTFRHLVKTPVLLFKNGVTTGKHASPGHPAGRAFDVHTARAIPFDAAFAAAIKAGFTAIGIYWNGKAYSYHLEHDPQAVRLWAGVRNASGGWDYGPLLQDPAKG